MKTDTWKTFDTSPPEQMILVKTPDDVVHILLWSDYNIRHFLETHPHPVKWCLIPEESAPPSEIKYIPLSDFVRLGCLQEINRRLLHPAGLALEVYVNEQGAVSLTGVWDYRDDPVGIEFGLTDLAPEEVEAFRHKQQTFDQLIEQHRAAREALYGNVVEQIP